MKPQPMLAKGTSSTLITRQEASSLLTQCRLARSKLKLYKRTDGRAYLATSPESSLTLILLNPILRK